MKHPVHSRYNSISFQDPFNVDVQFSSNNISMGFQYWHSAYSNYVSMGFQCWDSTHLQQRFIRLSILTCDTFQQCFNGLSMLPLNICNASNGFQYWNTTWIQQYPNDFSNWHASIVFRQNVPGELSTHANNNLNNVSTIPQWVSMSFVDVDQCYCNNFSTIVFVRKLQENDKHMKKLYCIDLERAIWNICETVRTLGPLTRHVPKRSQT